jgi:hypothetical protein
LGGAVAARAAPGVKDSGIDPVMMVSYARDNMVDLKTIKKLYKQALQPMGIYQIKNLASGKIYIGRSSDLNGKINSEKFQLKYNMHMNKELQNDFNNLGEEKFGFEVLDRLQPKTEQNRDYGGDLRILEEMWLDKLQPFGARGYHKKKP